MTCYLNCETYGNTFEPHGSGPLLPTIEDCYSTKTRSSKHVMCHSRVSPWTSKKGTAVNAVAQLASGRDPAVTGVEQASYLHADDGMQHYNSLIYSATVGPCLSQRPLGHSAIALRYGEMLLLGCDMPGINPLMRTRILPQNRSLRPPHLTLKRALWPTRHPGA